MNYTEQIKYIHGRAIVAVASSQKQQNSVSVRWIKAIFQLFYPFEYYQQVISRDSISITYMIYTRYLYEYVYILYYRTFLYIIYTGENVVLVWTMYEN